MSELKDGELLDSVKIQGSAEIAVRLSADMVAMLTSLYVSQKINEIKLETADFNVVLVKNGKAISVDEMVGNVFADKVTDFLAKNITRLYDVVDIVQQELEQWDVELVYKAKFYA